MNQHSTVERKTFCGICEAACGVVVTVQGDTGPGQFLFRDARVQAVFGQTWLVCPWMLMGISLPTLAGILWTLRSLAPTQDALAEDGLRFLKTLFSSKLETA